jgi:N6-L-threonylcarbamoyladenine synthase
MRILAIETSCDETAIAILEELPSTEGSEKKFRILANKTISQVELHRPYGGVFPALAKREHAKALVPLLVETLKAAGMYRETSRHVIEHPLRAEFQHILDREPTLFGQFISTVPHLDPPEIDRIAVTSGPGLEPALWTGINFAKALSMIWKKPVFPINHMEGHIFASFLKDGAAEEITLPVITFPSLALLVSGGHTELVLMQDWLKYEVIGETRDDAVGEAFDKVARILGLPYPGGPEISRLAETGTPGKYALPRPMLHSQDYSFSFAGLKTAVLYLVRDIGELSEEQKADIACEFEEAAVTVLIAKTIRAAKEYGATSILLGGGVSANKRLRNDLAATIDQELPGTPLYIPAGAHATDNALMIALAGTLHSGDNLPPLSEIKAEGHLRLA